MAGAHSFSSHRAAPAPPHGGQALRVSRPACGIRVEAFKQLPTQHGARRRKGVERPVAVLPGRNQSDALQVREVTRCGRLWDVEHGDKVPDAEIALAQQVKDSQPDGVGHDSEELLGVINHIRIIGYDSSRWNASECCFFAPATPLARRSRKVY
jgi:hypothetical protein